MTVKSSTFVICVTMFLISCREDLPAEPTMQQYTAETKLLTDVALKFLNEHDAEKLHKTAIALQLSRATGCKNYNGQCEAFSDFVSEVIKQTTGNKFAPHSQFNLRKKYDLLVLTIEDGKKKLDK